MNKVVDWEVLGRNHRVFLVEKAQTFWERLLNRPPVHEVLIFSNKRVEDMPSGWTGPKMPESIRKGSSIDRHRWRKENGLSSVFENMQGVLDGRYKP